MTSTVEMRADRGVAAGLDPADLSELHGVVAALCHQRRDTVVICRDEQRLGAVASHLARALRADGRARIEMCLPASVEALLARFNALLVSTPVGLARDPRSAPGGLRVWVVHLARRADLHDVQLLLRVAQSFPGAGVRLLLLLAGDAAAAASAGAYPLGTRLHRWTVCHPPDATSDEPASGFPSEVVSRAPWTSVSVPAASRSPDALPRAGVSPWSAWIQRYVTQGRRVQGRHENLRWGDAGRSPVQWRRLSMSVLILLAVSVAIVGFLHVQSATLVRIRQSAANLSDGHWVAAASVWLRPGVVPSGATSEVEMVETLRSQRVSR